MDVNFDHIECLFWHRILLYAPSLLIGMVVVMLYVFIATCFFRFWGCEKTAHLHQRTRTRGSRHNVNVLNIQPPLLTIYAVASRCSPSDCFLLSTQLRLAPCAALCRVICCRNEGYTRLIESCVQV